MYCDMCGARIPDAARFCRVCGAAIADEACFGSRPPDGPNDQEPPVNPALSFGRTPGPDRTEPDRGGLSIEQESAAQRIMAARSNDEGAVDTVRRVEESHATGAAENPPGIGQQLLWICGVGGFCLVLGSFLWHGYTSPKYTPDAVIALAVGAAVPASLIRLRSCRWTLSFLGLLSLTAVAVAMVGMIFWQTRPGQGYYMGAAAFVLACMVFVWATSGSGWYQQRNVLSKILVGSVTSYAMVFVILGMAGPIGAYLVIPLLSFVLANR